MTRQVGDYLLCDPIGRGATATVFRATGASSGDVVAVKLIAGAAADRARPWAHGLLQVDHPHAVRVRDVIDDGADLAVVMDLVEGPTLDEWLRRGHRLPPAQVQPLIATLTDAVKAVARAGVVHGDVAPRNVILSPAGPVLVDYGFGPGDPEDDLAAVHRLGELLRRPAAALPPSITVEVPDRPQVAAASTTADAARAAPPVLGRPRAIRALAAAAAVVIVAVVALTTFARPRAARAGTRTGDAPACATVRVRPGPEAGEKQ